MIFTKAFWYNFFSDGFNGFLVMLGSYIWPGVLAVSGHPLPDDYIMCFLPILYIFMFGWVIWLTYIHEFKAKKKRS